MGHDAERDARRDDLPGQVAADGDGREEGTRTDYRPAEALLLGLPHLQESVGIGLESTDRLDDPQPLLEIGGAADRHLEAGTGRSSGA